MQWKKSEAKLIGSLVYFDSSDSYRLTHIFFCPGYLTGYFKIYNHNEK